MKVELLIKSNKGDIKKSFDCVDMETIKVGLNRTDMGDRRTPAYGFKLTDTACWPCPAGKSDYLVFEKSNVKQIKVSDL